MSSLEWFSGPSVPCELCALPIHADLDTYNGHHLCWSCALIACGRCWRAKMEPVFGRVPWRLLHMRFVCPLCGFKGGWLR